ncbi:MAG: response regulator, partial [Verrucomicrobiota bacterium]
FWFTARFAAPDAPAASPAAQPDIPSFGNARVLLVEDNLTNQEVAMAFLAQLGLPTDLATTGTEALRAFESARYDLVLMDIQMPEMDGLEATKEIRKAESGRRKAESQRSEIGDQKSEAETAPPSSFILHPSSFSSRLPIIAMTGHALKGDREKCLEAGMDDYLTKPISFAALAAALERWLPAAEPLEGPALSGPIYSTDDTAVVPPFRKFISAATLSPEGSASPAVFDRAALMVRLQDNERLERRVIDGFLGDLPDQLAQLKAHAAAGDARGVQQQAHKIKGACATVGGDALSALASALEKAGGAGDHAGIAAGMPEIDAQFAALKAAMQEAV